MKLRHVTSIALSALLIFTAGCSASSEKAVSSGTGSTAASLASQPSASEAVSSMQSVVSEPNSSEQISSKTDSSKGATSTTESEKSQNDSEWVAYDTNKDDYKLHIKRKDGSEDKVIVNDIVLAPCVAGEWVYFFSDLSTIEKVRLDGSQRTKVGNTPEMMHLNGNMAIISEYKNGCIIYKTQQLHEVGNNSSYPPYYYKLDPDTNKITEVKNQ